MKSCSRKILQLFYNAKHSGRIVKPDAIGRIGEDNDGLVIELSWRVENGVITDAKFRAFGNPNAIAITSLVTDKLIGKTVEQSLELEDNILLEELGELLPEYIEVFDMVKLAIEEAYGNYLKKQNRKALQGIEEGEENSFVEDETQENIPEEVEIEPVDTVEEDLQNYIENSVFTPSKSKIEGEKRGRGRPRKVVDETEQSIAGEKRGRGRPRKIVDESEVKPVGEKRGRGRPRKYVQETKEIEVGEKRGRGRPRKNNIETTENVQIGEKRGRGRPRKIVDESEVKPVGEKRGRGRPRKAVDENAVQVIGEKRGRGRPRKNVDASNYAEGKERNSYNNGRIKIETLEDTFVEPEENESLENKNINNFNSQATNLNNTDTSNINDTSKADDVNDNLNNQTSQSKGEREKFVEKLITNNVLVDDEFDTNYDLFKSNIRNIFSGQTAKEDVNQGNDIQENEEKPIILVDEQPNILPKGVIQLSLDDPRMMQLDKPKNIIKVDRPKASNRTEAEEKRGRGRPRKLIETTETLEVGEKRGRGRPRKYVEETDEIEVGEKRGRGRPKKIVEDVEPVDAGEKRGRGRPRLNSINSLTRSLSTNGKVSGFNNTQDIVFASKNVTTTNINVNVTKTVSNYTESSEAPVVKYTAVQSAETINPSKQDEIEDDKLDNSTTQNNEDVKSKNLNDFVEENDEIEDLDNEEIEEDTSNIKDEAPSGLADLLKALLNEDDN